MLKRDITYTDFDDEEVTETFYFYLSKSELLELEVDGLPGLLKRLTNDEDIQGLFAMFKRIILAAYGVKSEDGKRFMKTDQIREEFTQTAAYDALYMELISSEDAAAKFLIACLPKELSAQVGEEFAKQQKQSQQTQGGTSSPAPPTPPSVNK